MSAQVPQSVHFSASITYFGSPSLIASTGHSSLQVPHIMQSSLILCVIDLPLSEFNFGVKIFHNHVGIRVMHQGPERNGFRPRSRTVKTPLPEMSLKNLPGFRIFFQDFPNFHLFIDLSSPFRHAFETPFVFLKMILSESFPPWSLP
jgi:hypothetical protein